MQKWLLPTLSEVLTQSTQNSALDAVLESGATDTQHLSISQIGLQQLKAEREWFGAIAALEHLLRSTVVSSYPKNVNTHQVEPVGLILAGPVAVLSDPELNDRFPSWIFSAQLGKPWGWIPFQLPPAKEDSVRITDYGNSLPLLPADPLATEQFSLVLTSDFSLVMVLGEDLTGTPTFLFSFEPNVVQQAWKLLRNRMLLTCPHQIGQLDALVGKFSPVAPDYRTVMQFSRLLLKHLPQPEEQRSGEIQNSKFKIQNSASQSPITSPQSRRTGVSPVDPSPKSKIPNIKSDDVELLQAFAHEVRTPLATIRTLTRLLLRRKDLVPDIIKRLEIIDHECTEQIDRMELLFRAAELENSDASETPLYLTTTSLTQVFQESIPRWQKQALRRNQTLDVVLPQQMPPVVSDPTMLDRILTGLVENFTRSLPAGSHIQVQVIPAGNQLKLQLLTQTNSFDGNGETKSSADCHSTRKLIGQLLMFQPETGSLSLNHNVTKSLFQALGGKLIVKQRPQQGEVLTIYLPTGDSELPTPS